ncbi:helix-turn-helix domain-containing protein [Guyparkeria halophila]|uniref:Helix-turn-helix domain-containing protein n=1 Tax=Guyparkeria halophila TaxID=47960 RepID=A0A6I6CZP8_9GAMM|nr:recombinase family protein [Guyparkeria halophila]QGT78910.1 helix-turn-helix domain-containing protein [Guyparkeria halophila]
MSGKVFGYARVSTTDQHTEAQEKALRDAGCDSVVVEKASAKDVEGRPKLGALMEILGEGDTLVVTKLDRLARSTQDLLTIADSLKAKGVGLRILNMQGQELDTSTPNGKFMLLILAGVAEFERELMLERQKEGIEEAKRKGKYKGRKPTARQKAPEVLKLAELGTPRKEIAQRLGIGVASVYRILSEHREGCSGQAILDSWLSDFSASAGVLPSRYWCGRTKS